MSKVAAAGVAALLLVLLILVTPFMFVGGGGSARAAAPGPGGAAGSASPVSAAAGGDCTAAVGCQTRPAELPYVPVGFYPDRYTSPGGECTSWAAALWPGHSGRGVTWSGDAGEWLANAAAQGYGVTDVPTVGAIVVWPRWYIPGNDATQFGHVAIVISSTATAYTVSEMNVVGQYHVDTRTIRLPGNQAGFIPLTWDAFA